MDVGILFDNALTYIREGIYRQGGRWLKLILATILLGIPMAGYVMRIYRGATPAPEVDDWRSLVVDGLKLVIVSLIYAIPVIILSLIPYAMVTLSGTTRGPAGSVTYMDPGTVGARIAGLLLLMLIIFILEIIIAILLPIASIRFARSGRFSDAFRFGEILAYIRKIGWINYLIALLLVAIVIGVPIFILYMIGLFAGLAVAFTAGVNPYLTLAPVILILIILVPLIQTFQARFLTEVYDSVPAAATGTEDLAAPPSPPPS
ncbi:MAG: DUF4013 domain-containing protein [Methanoregula sp.]|uniref:DUF4013 domain-containing protein n=1 Tax=Methanoregula sp. TaxID=2052170 RepID=UPI0025DCE824|nr:DUF4013 domain-containing protein [Methanoregula sp.]MCK9631712.1 DUF4013 domain-containing protein [Methanoregula sp.]